MKKRKVNTVLVCIGLLAGALVGGYRLYAIACDCNGTTSS